MAVQMRLLDRYLLRELLVPLGYCLSGFLIFWIAFDLFSEIDDFQEHSLSPIEVAHYYLVKTPEFLATVIPIALLLAALYALTNHARHHEITAIRCAGVGLWRISVPYLATGLIMSLGLLYLNEAVVPDSVEAAEGILKKREASASNEGRWLRRVHFRNDRARRIWNVEAFNPETSEMKRPQVEWNLPDGSSRHLFARSAVRTNDVWRFFEVQQITYWPPREMSVEGKPREFDYQNSEHEFLDMPAFGETPDQIESELKISRLSSVSAAKKIRLSVEEILHYFELHPDLNPRDEAMLKTQLHARLAAPWTCVVVILIALPFGAKSGKRNTFVGVASSILICFAFFILTRLGLALGTGGILAPVLAAWLPNAVFASLGVAFAASIR